MTLANKGGPNSVDNRHACKEDDPGIPGTMEKHLLFLVMVIGLLCVNTDAVCDNNNSLPPV